MVYAIGPISGWHINPAVPVGLLLSKKMNLRDVPGYLVARGIGAIIAADEYLGEPARSFGPAVFVGGCALSQLWLFIVAPLIGAVLAAVVYRGFTLPTPEIPARVAEQALPSG